MAFCYKDHLSKPIFFGCVASATGLIKTTTPKLAPLQKFHLQATYTLYTCINAAAAADPQTAL